LSHIGVEALREAGIEPDIVCGASMGVNSTLLARYQPRPLICINA